MGLGAGVALGQVMASQLSQGLQGLGVQQQPAGAAQAAGVRPDEVMATLEKLADLKAKGHPHGRKSSTPRRPSC
jgi:membrane protease subunit (stomatin/prohibitin family)